MNAAVTAALEKLSRDRGEPSGVLIRKALRYVGEVAMAPLLLVGVDEVGAGVRTYGRPRVVNEGRIELGDGVVIRSRPVAAELVSGPGGLLRIGERVLVNYGTSIAATGLVDIGDDVLIGPYAMIIDNEFHGPYARRHQPAPRPVSIEPGAWIGAKASILPGVRVGRGAIVGTAAVVTRDVPPYTVVAGVPARPIKQLDPERVEV